MKNVAGKDATEAFYGLHRSSILQEKRFERLRVGRVAGYEPPPSPPPTPYAEPLFIRKHSPYYNESHHKLRKDIRAFIEAHIAPTAADDDEFGEDPSLELNIKMGKSGILAAIVGPQAAELGFKPMGMDSFDNFDYFHDMVIAEEFKRLGTYGLSDGLVGGLSIGLPAVLAFGSAELKHRVGIPCLNGTKRIALAISEPYAGSDVANIQTRGKLAPDGKHYIVNGVKKWITGGRFADFFTTLVITEQGYALMVIERDASEEFPEGRTVTTKPIKKTSYHLLLALHMLSSMMFLCQSKMLLEKSEKVFNTQCIILIWSDG